MVPTWGGRLRLVAIPSSPGLDYLAGLMRLAPQLRHLGGGVDLRFDHECGNAAIPVGALVRDLAVRRHAHPQFLAQWQFCQPGAQARIGGVDRGGGGRLKRPRRINLAINHSSERSKNKSLIASNRVSGNL